MEVPPLQLRFQTTLEQGGEQQAPGQKAAAMAHGMVDVPQPSIKDQSECPALTRVLVTGNKQSKFPAPSPTGTCRWHSLWGSCGVTARPRAASSCRDQGNNIDPLSEQQP